MHFYDFVTWSVIRFDAVRDDGCARGDAEGGRRVPPGETDPLPPGTVPGDLPVLALRAEQTTHLRGAQGRAGPPPQRHGARGRLRRPGELRGRDAARLPAQTPLTVTQQKCCQRPCIEI